MKYNFYGWETADTPPASEKYAAVSDPRALYDLLTRAWCEYTCAPRLRPKWSAQDPTVGQCSVTAFLAQDVFGGKVYGIPRPDGSFHCYNEAGGRVFDLTSEQFAGEELSYEDNPEQSREVHFAKREKYERYLYLRGKLEELLAEPEKSGE